MSYFLLPIIGLGTSRDPWRAKYLSELSVKRSMHDFGSVGVCYGRLTEAQEQSIAAHSDAFLFPALDDTVKQRDVQALKNIIETYDVPMHWLEAGLSHRDMLRVICGMAQLWQRTRGLRRPLQHAGNLDTQLSAMSEPVREGVAMAADSLGVDRSSLGATSAVREALHVCGSQFGAHHPIKLGEL